MTRRAWIGSIVLLVAVVGDRGRPRGVEVRVDARRPTRPSANQPEPMESVTVAVATAARAPPDDDVDRDGPGAALDHPAQRARRHRPRRSCSRPGKIVEAGTVLVALDVSVEEAELKAQEAQAALAETLLGRMQRASENRAASEMEVDRARAERDVALAQIARTKAIIARKTIRAPFRARVGHGGRAPRPVPERGHAAHDAAGRRRRRARRLRRRAARSRRACARASSVEVFAAQRRARRSPATDRRGRRARRSHDAQRHGARADRARRRRRRRRAPRCASGCRSARRARRSPCP